MIDLLEKISSNPKTSFTLLISFLGLLFGIKRYLLASKKSKIDIKEFNDKQKKFSLYLVDFYRVIDLKKRYLIFHIKLTNRANSKNSYNAQLELQYKTESQMKNSVIIKHNSELFKNIKHKELTELSTNIRLNEKEIISGWLIFKLPNHLHKKRIEKYIISISDTENNILNIEAYIIKDIVYETKKI